ncbi:MAG: DUF4838 domain-containing protein [candidate division WS1 bacterium]|nr:DUF4838 domain-containing protein [candidate division WS1 bacterium]
MPPSVTRRQFLVSTTAMGVALSTSGVARSQEVGEPLTIVADGSSDYVIVRPLASSPSQVYAAEELQRFVRAMTGVELLIATDDGPLPPKAILLGATRHTAGVLGGSPDASALGDDGFHLRTAGEYLCIIAGPVRGALYGVYELLERYWGCRWYASFHSVIPLHTSLSLPDIDDAQAPAFAMREPYWWEMRDGDYAARSRANGTGMQLEERHGGKIRFGGGLFVHTFYRLVPPDEFFADHPEYYSLIDGERQIGYSQLCLTNPDVLRIVTERVLAAIRSDPTARLFSVSQNDWDGHCQCDACMEIEEREESPAGPLIHFVNQVAEAVEAEFPDVWIETLAYQYTRKPPKTIRPRHNVVPRLCTIECDFSLPLDESSYPQNVRFVEDIRGWSAITDKLYVWDYTTNFHNYVGPHPNFPAIPGNIRFFRDNRVVGLFEQGANEGPHAEFGELRSWLIAKLLWNPDQPVEPLLDDFFAGYYGAAAGPIRQYFDELQTLALDPEITVRIFDALRGRWLTREFVERAEALWTEAERLAADDPDLLRRVRMSGITTLWARVKLMGAPERVHVIDGGRLVYREVDPVYAAAARELLARVEEGDVRVREYTGYHQQEIIDLTGHAYGFELVRVTSNQTEAAAAPGCGGGAVLWTVDGGPNLLAPQLGGVQVVSRHDALERPDYTEFELVEAAEDSATLKAVAPRAVWGPQLRERLDVQRVLAVDADGLTLTDTYTLAAESQDVTPAVRVGLALAGPVQVRAGAFEASLASSADGAVTTLDLPDAVLDAEAIELLAEDGRVRIDLPPGRREAMSLALSPAEATVLLTVRLPEQRVSPEEPLTIGVRLSVPR